MMLARQTWGDPEVTQGCSNGENRYGSYLIRGEGIACSSRDGASTESAKRSGAESCCCIQ